MNKKLADELKQLLKRDAVIRRSLLNRKASQEQLNEMRLINDRRSEIIRTLDIRKV